MPNDISEEATPLFVSVPSVMLVGLSPEAQDEVITILAPLAVLRVGHIPAACERMVATRPLVVVLEQPPKEKELSDLRATALDITAQIVVLAMYPDRERRRAELLAAKKAAISLRDEAR